MREDWAALTPCTSALPVSKGEMNALQLAHPLPLGPPSPPTLQTLFTTKKFSMVFPLAKTKSPVSFTASGRISFTSWAMTPGELGGGGVGWRTPTAPSCKEEARFEEGEILGARDLGSKAPWSRELGRTSVQKVAVPGLRYGVPWPGARVDSWEEGSQWKWAEIKAGFT